MFKKVMMKNSNSFMGEEMRKVLICVTLSSYRSSTVVEWDNILIFWTSRKFKGMETGPVAITVSGPVSQQVL